MKRITWVPAVLAVGIETAIVFIAVFVDGAPYVASHSLGIFCSFLGFSYIAYFTHFVGQQDFIGGGCRPYTIKGPKKFFLLLMLMMLLPTSVFSLFLSTMLELLAQKPLPISLWLGSLSMYVILYILLLSQSWLKAAEDESIYINGQLLPQGQRFFLWPWLIEEYKICRHWRENQAPNDACH